MNVKFNPFDYFFILRPLILIPSWNFLLIGSYLARGKTGLTQNIVLGFILYTCVMGGIYILNQIMDIETDRINKKLFLLSEGYIPVTWAYVEMVLLWVTAIILSYRFGIIFLIFIFLSLLLGILYSLPPIKLKGKPIVDTLSNGIGYGVINFSVGWLLVRPFEWSMFHQFLPYALYICAVFINTTIVDIEGDKRAQELTTAVVLGEDISSAISTVLVACAVIVAFVSKDLVCLIPALISLPFFLYVAVYRFIKKKINRSFTIASFRLPGLLLTLITALLYPPYFLVLIVLFVGMRLYYKKRFGITYPTLAQG
ncbi:MAG: UbiA family prenyltransferase [candidate division WOR-3 bacterium]|nr:MAG: UbiA family prenyltransferase [candidate division WOR-3 bacterium]